MKYIFSFVILFIVCTSLMGQTSGTIKPSQTYTNTSNETVYYIPKSKVIQFLDLETKAKFDSIRIEKYKELTNQYQERISLADSASQVKNLEAEFWRQKLLSNDDELKAEKKTAIQLRADLEDVKRSRIYYFAAGIVATSIAVVALK